MDPWEAEGTDTDYYVPYTSLSRVENSVIDFDIQNMKDVLPEMKKERAEEITKRVNSHYLGSIRHEKRAFGNKHLDDFQRYNWGLSLSVEMGLRADQTELLLSFYTTTIEDRLTEKEFESIVILHTNFRTMSNTVAQQRKWRELKKSWKLLNVKAAGYPPSISKKDFIRLLDANFIEFDINMERLSRDMQNIDYDAAYLHMLLLDDPVIRGEFPPTKKDFCCFPKSRRKGFQDCPRGGDDAKSIAEFNQMLDNEENNTLTEQELQEDSEIESRILKSMIDDEEIRHKKMEKKLMIDSEMARRELAEAANDELAIRVAQIKKERKLAREGKRKKERAALVKAMSKPSGGREVPADVSIHIPSVSDQIHELKPPSISYKPPSPPASPPKKKIMAAHGRKPKILSQENSVSSPERTGSEKNSKHQSEAQDSSPLQKQLETVQLPGQNDLTKEEEVLKTPEIETDLVPLSEPNYDDDNYYIGEMAEASLCCLTDDLEFLDQLIFDTIEPPPPTKEEIAEWERRAAARRAEEERKRREKEYVEGLCDESVDMCIDRLFEEDLGLEMAQWCTEEALSQDACSDVLNVLEEDLLVSSVIDEYNKKCVEDAVDKTLDRTYDICFAALLGSHVSSTAKAMLTSEIAEEAMTELLDPFLEVLLAERIEKSITAKLDVDNTKLIMEQRAKEAAERKAEIQRQKEEAMARKREAAEKKARALAAKKEEEVRLKAEKKQRDLAKLEKMNQKMKAKKEASFLKQRVGSDEDRQDVSSVMDDMLQRIESKAIEDSQPSAACIYDVARNICNQVIDGCIESISRSADSSLSPFLAVVQYDKPLDEDKVAHVADDSQFAADDALEALSDELIEASLQSISNRLLSYEEDEEIEEAVNSLISDQMHLKLQNWMSETGSLASIEPRPPTPRLFEVTDAVKQPTCFPSLKELYSQPFVDYRFNVPKTNGQLRVHIRHDDEGDASGLFIHGFKSYSRAEEQGLLQLGDEILELNNHSMENKSLEDVIVAMEGHTDEFVTMVVRRHEVVGGLQSGTMTPKFSSQFDGLGGSVVSSAASASQESYSSSPRPYIVAQTQPPLAFPSIEDLMKLPSREMKFNVPKTNGQLRIELRHDDNGEASGIFIHGFRPFSEAKKQGLLKIGDELLAVEGINVCGRTLEDVIQILSQHFGSDVEMVVCRRDHIHDLEKWSSYFSHPNSDRSERLSRFHAGDPLSEEEQSLVSSERGRGREMEDLRWEDIAEDDASSSVQQSLIVGEKGFSVSTSEGAFQQDKEDNGSLAATSIGLPDGNELDFPASFGSKGIAVTHEPVEDLPGGGDVGGKETEEWNENLSGADSTKVDNTKGERHTSTGDERVSNKPDDKESSGGFLRFFTNRNKRKRKATESTASSELPNSASKPPLPVPKSTPLPIPSPSPSSPLNTQQQGDDSQSAFSPQKKKFQSAVRKTRDSIRIVKLSDPSIKNSLSASVKPGLFNSSAPSTARTAKSNAFPEVETFTEVIEVDAPRTDNQLRVMIKAFNNGKERGFYIHGFQPMCKAEGILLAGDQIQEIDGKPLVGLALRDLANIIGDVEGPSVRFKLKRSYTIPKS